MESPGWHLCAELALKMDRILPIVPMILLRGDCGMSWQRNLPISRKFTLAFGAVCCLCLVLGT
jgi:hypothetical protein